MARSDRGGSGEGEPRDNVRRSAPPCAPVRDSGRGGRTAWLLLMLSLAGVGLLRPSPFGSVAIAQEEDKDDDDAAADDGARPGDTDIRSDDGPEEASDEGGIALPTDRLKERQLDRVRRLAADGRFSDSATLLDEILAGDRDFFFRPGDGGSTWRSIKTEASGLLGGFPEAGREAYELQFRARAERLLEQAIVAGDAPGVVAVARRWFHTPAGRRATLLAALDGIETGRPLEAAAWLERLAAAPGAGEFEPTLSLMRAVAWWRAGERRTAGDVLDGLKRSGIRSVRVGGRDVPLDHTPGSAGEWLEKVAGPPAGGSRQSAREWWVHRGDASRNALVDASRPLLVPRYRVPLTRHPEEGRLLERRRKLFADRDMPLLPAGSPLAVDGLLLAHTPMGLLAVDFETGKRVWLRTGGAAGSFFDSGASGDDGDEGGNAEARAAIRGVFEDATSGTLSSDGELVFAVESDPASLAGPSGANVDMFRQFSSGPRATNVLAAYRLAKRGEPAWRLSGADAAGRRADGDPLGIGMQQLQASQGKWFLGAPLPIGDQLFVLVEERGEIRLEVLGAADGSLRWSQPLAELDEGMQIGNRESHLRRVGGLSPSFADGVLVCPTGAGTVVAVDLATRTLLWAYTYSQPKGGDSILLPNGVRVQRGVGGGGARMIVNGQLVGAAGPTAATGWRDSSPVLVGGKIVLTPRESDEIHCLDLRTGSVVWKAPRQDGLYLAGAVDGRAIVVGRRGVRSLALADGGPAWSESTGFAGACPSGRGVLTGGRLFLPLDTPEVVEIDLADGSVAGRSPARGHVAGNLVAYRGEVVSQGVDSLDVFHQASALGERVDTALRTRPGDPWAALWRGHVEIDRGNVAEGLASVFAARDAAADGVPVPVVREALLAALERDFPAALGVWRSRADVDVGPSRPIARLVVEGHLRAGEVEPAWHAFAPLLDGGVSAPWSRTDTVAPDPGDRNVGLSDSVWLAGRFRRILEQASPELRREIDTRVAAEVAAAEGVLPVVERTERLATLDDRLAGHPAAARVRELLLPAIGDLITATGATTDAGRDLAVRRDLLRGMTGPADASPSVRVDAAWPFGRVVERRGTSRGAGDDPNRIARLVPIPLDGADPATSVAAKLSYDVQQSAFVVVDGFGRRVGDPFTVDAPGRGDGWNGFQPYAAEASVVGRVMVVRSGGTLIGYEISDVPGQRHRRLWGVNEQTANPAEQVMPFLGRQIGERHARLDTVPLGMEISEPEEVAQVPSVVVGRVRATGLPVLVNSSLVLRDPATGAVRWERHHVPAVGDVAGDDEFVCVLPPNGRQAAVVSMVDGRLVRTLDLPPRGRRLLTCGRRIVTVGPREQATTAAEGQGDGPIVLELVDPATLERTPLGSFSREALASRAGADALAVVEPGGAIVVLDLVDGHVRFRTKLRDMPVGMDQLRVMAWEDRYLVFVGRRETAEERKLMEKVGMITSLPQQFSRENVPPATGSLWALDRADGAMLWPVPATILRHCIHPGQPEALPMLLFARQIQRGGSGDRVRLGVLGIDKRTGQALVVDDKLANQQQFLAGCEMSGDPAAHSIAVGPGGGEGGDLVLEFTAQPTAPRPPFQAASRQPVSRDVLSELEHWLEKAITLPIPSF